MAYGAGDTVVHPQHGMATVAGVVSRDLGTGPADYLELFVETRSLRIMVPAAAVDEVGIRDVATKAEAQAILALLETPSDPPEGWSERSVSTVARMRSTALDQVCMVVRDLSRHQHRSGKPLSMKESNLLTECLDSVAKELAVALGLPEDEARALILDTSLRGETASA